MLKADLHTHTKHSHALNSIAEMAETAKKIGLAYLGFSEHSPRPKGYNYAADYQEKLRAGFPSYIADVQALCRTSTPEFSVLLGLELDFIPAEQEFAISSCTAYPYDYVIGSVHFQDDWGFDSNPDTWNSLEQEARFNAYSTYYQDLIKLCEVGIADIIGHPDLIKIFSIESFNKWLELDSSMRQVNEFLVCMRDHDLLLEVSSAGLRKPCNEIYPGPRIMQAAAKLGLKLCPSSDAHSTEQLAYAFDQLEAYVKQFGYTSTYIVNKKEKIQLNLAD